MKKRCAKEALCFVKDKMVVGLGGGSTIAYLVEYLAASALDVKVVTPSFTTRTRCIEAGLQVIDTDFISHVDVAFDGCDEVDAELSALKSGGGIHTLEKIIGTMATDYILLVDETKYVNSLRFEHPVVLEVCQESLACVTRKVEALGGRVQLRASDKRDGPIMSERGMCLLDAMFEKANIENVFELHQQLRGLVGVLEISLFCNVATKVLLAKAEGFELIERDRKSM